jgi:hypothetical protein
MPIVSILKGKRSRDWFWPMLILILSCALLFVPYKSTTVPPWRVEVVDENNDPISGLQVQEEWEYVGIDIAGWIDYRYTDTQGRVSFPRRTIWASLASRNFGIGSHEHVGPSAFILACDDSHLKEARMFWDGNPLWDVSAKETKTRLVAKSVKDCPII